MESYPGRRIPGYVSPVPDIRTRDPQKEIRRSIKVIKWLERLRISDLIQSHPPEKTASLVSVVVPMYNAGRWIEMCLKGLLAQTHSNLEIFCVDDCSEDDTYERVVDQFGSDRRLCVVRLARNVGPFQISNWAAGSLARGRLVAWQDADNISHPARIEEQCRWMLSHGYKISGACLHCFFPPNLTPFRSTTAIDADGMLHSLAFYSSLERTREPVIVQRGSRRRKYLDWLRNDATIRRAGGLIARTLAFSYLAKNPVLTSHASQIVDRSLFLEFGGFYGRTKFGEDTEFDWRLLRFHGIGNIPKVLCSRRFHSDSLTQHPSTGYGSPGRRLYRERIDAKEEEIRQELISGNINGVRELCTESLYCADIEIDAIHTGFDVDLPT